MGGLFLIGIGILMMLNPQGRSSWVWRILVYFPRALVGVLVIAAGLAVIGLGVWEWLDSQAFHAFIKTARRSGNYSAGCFLGGLSLVPPVFNCDSVFIAWHRLDAHKFGGVGRSPAAGLR